MMQRVVLALLLSCCCLGHAVADVGGGLPLYFWDARSQKGFANFGDALSEALVARMVGRPVPVAADPYRCGRKLLAVGSILSYASDGDVLWGTGLNGKTPRAAYRFGRLDVRAVRGPLTRAFLLERGVACPEVYGDPTLLLPRCFPELRRPPQPSKEYVIVPHYSDEHLFAGHPHMVSVRDPWREVVRQILDSRLVIASALSGVIVAEAYGIPARLLVVDNAGNTEDLVKYADYYLGSGRSSFTYATSVEQALEMGGEPPVVCDLDMLYRAFPFELYRDAG